MIDSNFDVTANTKWYYKLNWNSTDSSWNWLNWTDTNISYVAGKFWDCASFNWTNSSISIANTIALQLLWNYTYWWWFNHSNITSTQRIINKDRAVDFTGWYTLTLNTNWTYNYYIGHIWWWAERWWFTWVVAKPIWEWHHFIVRYDWANIKLFIDAIEVYSKAVTTNLSADVNAPLIFWAYWSTPTWQWLYWKIDEVIIEDRAWTAEEILNYYNKSQERYLWEYLGASSSISKLIYHLNWDATDSSWNWNNGTATNISYVSGKLWSGSASFNWTNAKISVNQTSIWTWIRTFSFLFNSTSNQVDYAGLIDYVVANWNNDRFSLRILWNDSWLHWKLRVYLRGASW